MNRVLWLVPILAAGCLDAADPASTEQDAAPADAHAHLQKGAHGGGGGGTSSNLVDHGGRVLPSSNTYAIWWGTQSAFPSDARAGLDSLFEGLNGTSFLNIAQQYMRGASMTTSFHTNWTDTTTPPRRSPSTSTIVNEACKAITANGATPDPTAVYFVYTSNFPGRANFCAWHSDGTCNGQTIQVAYMPNTTGMAGCDPGDLYACNSYSQGTRSLANVSSHEYMESLTDADINAWYDSSGSEIGDKCAWQFQSCVATSTGSWQLQEEWSNATSGCVQ
jgi:hypothetical protein